jgi:serine/threonine protein kinase
MEKFITTEVIFSSSNTLIQKGKRKTDDFDVIIKRPVEKFPSSSLIESYRKDFLFTQLLQEEYPEHFIQVIELIEEKNGILVLVEEDEGISLSQFLSNRILNIEEFISIAKDMTNCLVCTHSKQIIHRDVKIGNFIYSFKHKKTKIIDFGASVLVSRKSPSVVCNNAIGTISYMPPEQTGRISKFIDYRSDIYSLGISFYEMLTGSLPFTGDKLSIVHQQITKKLPNVTNVPKAINEMIQKMCSKNPSERYQSTIGVLKDLESFSKMIGSIPSSFEIGKFDVKQFQIPNKLYGREKEIMTLKKCINSSSKMILVSGMSGMGKSKLIEEVFKDKTLNLTVAVGKFDQFNKLTPYSAFITFSFIFSKHSQEL